MFAARAAFMSVGAPAGSAALSLLHFDNNVTDIGASAATWTRTGGSFSTTAKFGTHSLSLPGSNSLYSNQSFSVPSSFTAECWFKPSSLSQVCNIFGMQTVSGYAPVLAYQVNGTIQFNFSNGANTSWALVSAGSSSGSFSTTSFSHIAISANSTAVKGFVNGSEVVTAARPSWSTSLPFYIGNDSGGGYPMNGLIDEFRFDSVCYYTGSFTAPTAAFS